MVGARRKRSSGPWTLPCTCCGPEPSNPAVNQSGLTSPCQRIQAGQRHHSRTGRAPIYTSTLAKPHHLLPIFPPATVNCVPLSAPIVLYSHCLSATCLVCLSTPPAISISINRSFSCHTAAFTGASRISSPVQHSLSPRRHFLENACRLRPAATGTAGSPRRTRSCCRLRARRRGTTEQSIRLDAHGPGKCTTRAPQKTGQRMRKQLLRLRSPRRSGPLLPSNGSLLRRPGRSRSMLSSGRCMYRSSRRPNSQPHRNYVSAICDRQHNHGRALRAADERRKPRKHAACSSAYTSCQSDAASCTNALANGAPGVTVSAPNGGATITAIPSVGLSSAQSICSSLSSLGCSQLTVEACRAFDGNGNAAWRAPCRDYLMTAGVALGIAGQLLT